jgi:hypothetical protein
MKLPNSAWQSNEHASVLILVLWIAIGLVSIALYFAHSMTFELRASDNRATGLAAEQAIEGAARYVTYVLSNFATNGAMPNNTQFSGEAVPVGDAHFWIIGRDPSGTPSADPYFGLIDEASKLNLNRAGTNALSYLPNMTLDFAGAIVDWRGAAATARARMPWITRSRVMRKRSPRLKQWTNCGSCPAPPLGCWLARTSIATACSMPMKPMPTATGRWTPGCLSTSPFTAASRIFMPMVPR